jgi:hypothetical protein
MGVMTRSAAEDRLAALATEWSAARDLRGVFADCYRVMTARMSDGVLAGDFDDAAWVSRLRDRFADYYFDALDAYASTTGEPPCPETWRIALDACARPGCHPLEALLLGINAHINHDLALALVDVLDDWPRLDDRQRAGRHRDHDRVNDIIRATTDEVQRDVVAAWSPAASRLDAVFGRVDEWAFGELVEHWRTQVWADAMTLVALPTNERPAAAARIDVRSRRLAGLISLAPG